MDNKYEGGGGINAEKNRHFYSLMHGMDEDETDSGYATSANEQMKVSQLCRVFTPCFTDRDW